MHSISAGGGGGGGGAEVGIGGWGGRGGLLWPVDPGGSGISSSSSSDKSMQATSTSSLFLAELDWLPAKLFPDLFGLSSSFGTGFQLPSRSRMISFSSVGSCLDSMISWKNKIWKHFLNFFFLRKQSESFRFCLKSEK